jgi:hypothetical protein
LPDSATLPDIAYRLTRTFFLEKLFRKKFDKNPSELCVPFPGAGPIRCKHFAKPWIYVELFSKKLLAMMKRFLATL